MATSDLWRILVASALHELHDCADIWRRPRRDNLISTFCGACGAPRRPEDLFCPQCGSAYPDAPAIESEQAAAAPPTSPVVDDQPYGGEITLLAVIGTLFVPLISLIIALVVRSGEKRESRRGFLKTWAIACAAWMCTGWIVAVLFFLSVSSSIGGGGCQGGVDPFSLPTYTSQDGQHWNVTRSCVGGGTKTRPATPAENHRLNNGG